MTSTGWNTKGKQADAVTAFATLMDECSSASPITFMWPEATSAVMTFKGMHRSSKTPVRSIPSFER